MLSKISTRIPFGQSRRKHRGIIVLVVATFVAISSFPAATAEPRGASHGVLNRAIKVLGGPEVLAATSNLQIEASGAVAVSFEGFDPGEAVAADTYTRSYSIDLDQSLIRVDVTRQPLFEVFQFFPEEDFTIVANQDIGHLSDQAVFTPPGDLATQHVTALWRQQMLFNPQLLLAEAAKDRDAVTVGRTVDLHGRPHQVLSFDNEVAPIHLYVDQRTALISKLVTMESNPLVRDVEVEVHYRSWRRGQGMPYPTDVELVVDGLSIWEEHRTSFATNQAIPESHFDNLSLADPTAYDANLAEFGRQTHHLVLSFFSAGFTYSPEQSVGAPVELAPGVHHVATGTGSLIVEQADGLVLLEAPLSPAYGSTLIDVASSVSNQPISHIVQTHHHVDHASGVRSIVAAGAELVVGPGVGDLWDTVLTAESTIRPDALSHAPVDAVVHEVVEGSSWTLDDAMNTITAYSVPGPHARDMLVTAIDTGNEVFVVNGDLYNGGFGLSVALPGPSIFFEALRTTGLIDGSCNSELPMTIVSIHGIPLSLADALAEVDGLGIDVGC